MRILGLVAISVACSKSGSGTKQGSATSASAEIAVVEPASRDPQCTDYESCDARCKQHHPFACDRAELLLAEKAPPDVRDRGSCERGNGLACDRAVGDARYGNQPDEEAAKKFEQLAAEHDRKNCDAGEPWSCWQLARAAMSRDFNSATDVAAKACRGGVLFACSGIGVPSDEIKKKLFETGLGIVLGTCKRSGGVTPTPCADAVDWAVDQVATEMGLDDALKTWKQAAFGRLESQLRPIVTPRCPSSADACVALAVLDDHNTDRLAAHKAVNQRIEVIENACKDGKADHCLALAVIRMPTRGFGLQSLFDYQDNDAGLRAAKRACELDPQLCRYVERFKDVR